jgi:hypothetical protein
MPPGGPAIKRGPSRAGSWAERTSAHITGDQGDGGPASPGRRIPADGAGSVNTSRIPDLFHNLNVKNPNTGFD